MIVLKNITEFFFIFHVKAIYFICRKISKNGEQWYIASKQQIICVSFPVSSSIIYWIKLYTKMRNYSSLYKDILPCHNDTAQCYHSFAQILDGVNCLSIILNILHLVILNQMKEI